MKQVKSTHNRVSDSASNRDHVLELAEEFLDVTTREQETGRVRVRVYTQERQEVVDEPLIREDITLKRVSVGRVVEQASGIRQEGETTIVPIYEEVLVVEKRLVLKEEIHLTRNRNTERSPQSITVRQEHAEIERSITQPAAFRRESSGNQPTSNNEPAPGSGSTS